MIAFYRLEGSRLGRAWAAIREDEVAAQATGINTPRVKLMAFAIGASTSGLAGVFFASQIGYFNPDNFILNNSILVVAYVVFGGMGSLPGAMAGAAILTWLPWFLQDQVPGPDRQMWVGALLVLMMIFRPAGLFPARRRKAELTGVGWNVRRQSNVRRSPRARGCDAMTATMTRPEVGAEDVVFDIEHVTLRFGGVVSLNDVSLRMLRGEILAIIGPNGAGKTSLFNSLTGVYTPQEGRIVVSGRPGEPPTSVIGMKTHNVNHLGRRTDVPEHSTVPCADCVGEREDRRGNAAARRSGVSDARPAVATPRGEAEHDRRIRLARRRRAGELGPTNSRDPCRTANSADWRSPARSAPIPASCCWTSRRRAPTRSRNASSRS